MIEKSAASADKVMGWLEWTSSVIGSTAWPIAFIVVSVIFKGHIGRLLNRIKGAKYGDAEVLFKEELDKIEAQVEELSMAPETPTTNPAPAALPLPDSNTDKAIADKFTLNTVSKTGVLNYIIQQEKFREIAKLSPNAAILATWRDVENALENLYNKHDMPRTERKNLAFTLGVKLYSAEIIDKRTMDLINDLKDLRNTASRLEEVSLSDALRFQGLAQQLIDRLRNF